MFSKEITTVSCSGVNDLAESTQATVESGATPRAVSCRFVITIEFGSNKKRQIACHPAVDYLPKRPTEKQILHTRCIHAYPTR